MENTSIKIVLTDGKEVELTMTFGLLYKLRSKDKDSYDRYNDIIMEGVKDMMDYPTGLYTGYLCKCIEDGKDPEMKELEFAEKLPYSLKEIFEAYKELTNAGKKMLFVNRSLPEPAE